MNKLEVIKTLNNVDEDYIVIGDAALVLHDLKQETSNITVSSIKNINVDNIIVSNEIYDEYVLINNIKVLPLNVLRKNVELQYINKIDKYLNLNPLATAYIGDAIYELYIRKYLIDNNVTKVSMLQKQSINYVSAKNQARFLKDMLNNNFFNQEELEIINRARNHKSHSSKNTDIVTYKYSTALESLIGYLYLSNNIERINDIMNYIKEV